MNDQPDVLDLAVVAELRDSVGGDEVFVRELVDAYLAESPGHLDAMATAAAGGDATSVIRPAHTLKSSSAAVGAMRLAAISKGVEFAAREGRVDQAGIDKAKSLWTETVSALAAARLTGD
jgi:two-component system, sensor histidine kinase and response regulator